SGVRHSHCARKGNPMIKHRLAQAATLVGWIGFMVVIALHYFGHAPGPYGACYARNGRDVPCVAVKH
ncbi:MAG: hypothetical protein ACJ8AD_17890, partial [Gemmatimonadaceae bacterium]